MARGGCYTAPLLRSDLLNEVDKTVADDPAVRIADLDCDLKQRDEKIKELRQQLMEALQLPAQIPTTKETGEALIIKAAKGLGRL